MAINKLKRLSRGLPRMRVGPLWSRSQGKAILNLFRRSYWHQISAIQDILMAQNIVLFCGTKQFGWNCITVLFKILGEIEDSRIYHHRPAFEIQSSFAMRICFQKQIWDHLPPNEQRMELFDIIEPNHNFELDYALLKDLDNLVDQSIETIHIKWKNLNLQAHNIPKDWHQDHEVDVDQLIAHADAEIERFQSIIRNIDELQLEWNTIRIYAKTVKHMRSLSEFYDHLL
jgi:hypothetical protein